MSCSLENVPGSCWSDGQLMSSSLLAASPAFLPCCQWLSAVLYLVFLNLCKGCYCWPPVVSKKELLTEMGGRAVCHRPACHAPEWKAHFSSLSDLVTKAYWGAVSPTLRRQKSWPLHVRAWWVSFPGYLVLLGKGMARARSAEALMQMCSHNCSGVYTAPVSTPTDPHHQPCHQERLATVSSQYPNPLWCLKNLGMCFVLRPLLEVTVVSLSHLNIGTRDTEDRLNISFGHVLPGGRRAQTRPKSVCFPPV